MFPPSPQAPQLETYRILLPVCNVSEQTSAGPTREWGCANDCARVLCQSCAARGVVNQASTPPDTRDSGCLHAAGSFQAQLILVTATENMFIGRFLPDVIWRKSMTGQVKSFDLFSVIQQKHSQKQFCGELHIKEDVFLGPLALNNCEKKILHTRTHVRAHMHTPSYEIIRTPMRFCNYKCSLSVWTTAKNIKTFKYPCKYRLWK